MTETTTDIICPFLIDSGLSRGQIVRLQKTLDTILFQHNYPEPIGILIAKSAVLTALLASIIKFDSVFTLQIQGSGPVSVLAIDMTANGEMRGYSRFDEKDVLDAYQQIQNKESNEVSAFFKEGTLSFYVETNGQSYQGITALDQPTLEDCVLEYFKQSEQIDTTLKLEVATPAQTGKGWIASALMLQRLPFDKKTAEAFQENEVNDLWETACILLNSASKEEMLDTELPLEKLLYRLYHANNLHFFIQKAIQFGCRCSKDKVINMLKSFSDQERQEMTDNGVIKVDCQFCGKSYTLGLEDLNAGK